MMLHTNIEGSMKTLKSKLLRLPIFVDMSNLIHNLRLTSIHFLLEKLYFLIPVGNKNVLGNMKVT